MFHFYFDRLTIRKYAGRPVPFLPLVALPFLVGALSGCVIGTYSNSVGVVLGSSWLFSANVTSATFAAALWNSFRFILAAAFFATSILGVALIPSLSALRGFCFSCSVSVILQTNSFANTLRTLLTFGLPAILWMPSFFLAATDAFLCSQSLLRSNIALTLRDVPFVRHIILIVTLCLADACYICCLLPKLLDLLS